MLRLFYFSGTGNARNVAHWIASVWRERGRQVEVADLSKTDPRTVQVGEEDEVGFASPTHGFNFPPITLAFLFAFPRAPHANRAFVVNTRAGVRFFGLPIPGLSGLAQLWAALVLRLKGYRVVGMRPVDLPSNWISLHPGLREDNVRALCERCQRISRGFAERLLDGKRDYRALWDLPQDLAVSPISLGYYLAGRFLLAKSFIASRDCDGCGACVKGCPTGALRMVDGRPFWTWRCESCMRCMNQCPKRAIETAHGFFIGVLVLLSMAMTALVHPALRRLVPFLTGPGLAPEAARNVLETVLTLAALFGSYRLLHRALRLRAVERLVVGTSLTHWRWWRRYRAPRADSTEK
ncbi:MAG TPA: EFR1 family ferrodoxin [Myxococcales bacterium]|jgi:ferredoxin